MGSFVNMKLAFVCLLASQALAFPSSSEEEIDMRSLSSSEEEIDMRASSSEEEDIGMRKISSSEEEIGMRAFYSSEEDIDMRAFSSSEEEFAMRAATCKCGVKGGANRIVGGVEAKANDYKTLYKPSEMVWTLGEHDFLDTTETKIPAIKVKVEKIIVSPEWDSMTTIGDIALIKLAKPVDLKKYTPACMAKTGQSFVGKSAWVYGWGQTSFKADMGEFKLRKLEVKVASNKECMAWSDKNTMRWALKDSQVCAGAGVGKDSCKGDSGGPLTSVVNGRHVLIGDVSNGNACKGPYSVYGSIAYYRKRIDSTMASNGGANFCSA